MSIDPDVVARRLAVMRRLLAHLEGLRVSSAAELADLGVRLQVERVLTQLVNLAAEINAHVAAATGLPPEDYRQGFDRMAEEGFLTEELADRLKPSVGLRDVLTHEYVEIDLTRLASSIPMALEGYDQYVRQVAGALLRGGTD
ncbi:hypothetical protein GCM10009785_23930 [Brooklawnia cerclae]|uniref:Uncharacterized protein YutE (UPF0331/DUF86 family) n=1 Tax=Brooklawnia cerclae TaxID=349934 RepID=A0ABX0SFW4_9ACTN|nr:HepT-like ribonuclease domain-containing protein [Brooklawnia cerclae]NIH55641.1 uncharacterized protein YutE (UPF0331/DUF86 family) [Brooklawnia cerclae]